MRAPLTAPACVAILFVVAFCEFGIEPSAAESGLHRYRSLVALDPLASLDSRPSSGVRVTYLGTNGYLLEASDASILVDPYFTRIGVAPVATNCFIKPNIRSINSALDRLPKEIGAILVTHGHFDHLLDVPEIARRTGAPIIASPTSCNLAQAAGLPASKTVPVLAGESVHRGAVRVRVLTSIHDRIFGVMPFPGLRSMVPRKAPARPSDWVCGEPLAFLVELGGKRIYVDSGGTAANLPDVGANPVDLAILGVYLPDSRRRVLAALRQLRPRYFLPSHQDNFFRPLSDGFQFGPMTGFSQVLGSVQKYNDDSSQPTKLILLDYFAPWTLK